MSIYTCQTCGATLVLTGPPAADARCPNCHRRLHICDNCALAGQDACLTHPVHWTAAATHGILCTHFHFFATEQADNVTLFACPTCGTVFGERSRLATKVQCPNCHRRLQARENWDVQDMNRPIGSGARQTATDAEPVFKINFRMHALAT